MYETLVITFCISVSACLNSSVTQQSTLSLRLARLFSSSPARRDYATVAASNAIPAAAAAKKTATMAAAAKAAPKLVVRTFNKINAAGLSRFDPSMFQIKEDNNDGAHAILLRSHKLQASDVPLMCRSIARCGAGTNNCNVPLMSELGVPVFNTPGANANAVKELVLCGLLMASRGIYEGAAHMVQLHKDCLLYTSPSPRDQRGSRMPSSA